MCMSCFRLKCFIRVSLWPFWLLMMLKCWCCVSSHILLWLVSLLSSPTCCSSGRFPCNDSVWDGSFVVFLLLFVLIPTSDATTRHCIGNTQVDGEACVAQLLPKINPSNGMSGDGHCVCLHLGLKNTRRLAENPRTEAPKKFYRNQHHCRT